MTNTQQRVFLLEQTHRKDDFGMGKVADFNVWTQKIEFLILASGNDTVLGDC